jgi:hypothetical protein
VHGVACEFARAAAGGAKQGSLVIAGDADGSDVLIKEGFELVVRQHFVALAAFFVEADPPAFAVGKIIFSPHGDDGADAGEFHRLADVPPEVEWFANLGNAHTRRAYENAVSAGPRSHYRAGEVQEPLVRDLDFSSAARNRQQSGFVLVRRDLLARHESAERVVPQRRAVVGKWNKFPDSEAQTFSPGA